ncbi:hypothetical protein VP1G_03017 [Cytospora mali]|uniref:Uncharacterized protein n=1 Tax=Cytospora mali TaxID=578113 RepID=A0A194UVL2_CYTMA|nr:hypothetical protein VP1G_03017 [Valsa mali var. pyri (nom. inval.)]
MNFPPSEWSYSYNTNFSQPLSSVVNDKSTPEVILDAVNIRPISGSFDPVNATLAVSTNGAKQIHMYAVRHGSATHNEQSDRFSKPISWRFFARIRANFDPGLTEKGIDDAKRSGRILKGLIFNEGAPRPVRLYTSPLKRCIETAMYMIKELELTLPNNGIGVMLCVREGLREWVGCGHDHQSDRRGTAFSIISHVADLNMDLELRVQTDIDPKLCTQAQVMHTEDQLENLGFETFTDVDMRVRSVLDEIFEVEKSGSCVMLVMHNRSHKCFLRVMGHSQDTVDKFDQANCAILSYLVRRTGIDGDELNERHEDESKNSEQWRTDLRSGLADKNQHYELAAEDVKRLSNEDYQSLENYLMSEAGEGDTWAEAAVIDLRSCRTGTGVR